MHDTARETVRAIITRRCADARAASRLVVLISQDAYVLRARPKMQ